MPDILALSKLFKTQLAARDEVAIRRLIEAYVNLQRRLESDIEAITAKMLDAELTKTEVLRLPQYKRFMAQMDDELRKYSGFVDIELGNNTRAELRAATIDSARLLRTAGAEVGASIQMRRVPVEVLQELLGFLDTSGPLYKRLGGLTDYVKEQVKQAILEGVGLGFNPRTTARVISNITDGLGTGLTDSMRMMRTAQLYAYREASRANYVANNDVVTGWVWYAHLETACLSCVAQHGTEHPLEETLDDHHNGECFMVPLVIGLDNPVEQKGVEYFEALNEGKQRARMGDSRWQAWKDGKFEFMQISAEHQDEVYGVMRAEASLKSLIGEE